MPRSQATLQVGEPRHLAPQSDNAPTLPVLNHSDLAHLEDRVGTLSKKPTSSEDLNYKRPSTIADSRNRLEVISAGWDHDEIDELLP
jgi:hypothetical protein